MGLRQIALGCIALLAITASACNDADGTSPTPTATIGRSVVDLIDDIGGFDAKIDDHGPWRGLIVQGVSVELPTAEEWATAIITDACSDDLGKFIITENRITGTRIKVDISRRSVVAEFGDRSDDADKGVVDLIRLSLRGERVLDPAARRVVPLPTNESCDPSVEIPTLTPD